MKIIDFTLPYITAELPGIKGVIKEKPADFIVEEIPLYEPKGEGQHVYVSITREGHNTRYIQKRLAQAVGIKRRSVGYAGLKDRWARTTQVFSLNLPGISLKEVEEKIEENVEDVEINWIKRHRNKLRVGHLLGNRFEIILAQTKEDPLAEAREIARALQERGLANFYGEQRFGKERENLEGAKKLFAGEISPPRWKRRFYLSAYQSHLFNYYLFLRLERGAFQTLLAGDIAKKRDTGGLFTVENLEGELPRFENREIVFTGPIYGGEMLWPQEESAELEKEVLYHGEVSEEELAEKGAGGSRRRGKVYVDDLEIESHLRGLRFTFSLPKGSYATTLLREFQK